MAITQRNGESSDLLARYCEFSNLKMVADPEAYLIQLRFIAGLQNSEQKLKVLEHLQQNPDATIDDIFLREPVNYKRRQPENAKLQPASTTSAKECPKCRTRHEPRSCPAFGKTCNNCKKRNHFGKVCRVKKPTILFVGEEANIEEISGSTSDNLFFFGHTEYIKNGVMEL